MLRGTLAALILLGLTGGSTRGDMIKLAGLTELDPGQTSTYVLQFVATGALTIESFDLALAFDPAKAAISNVRLSGETASAFATTVNLSISGGLIATASANSSGLAASAGSTTGLLIFDVRILPDATGTTDLNVLRNLSTTTTSVNESLALDPAPTNGFDPGVDLRISVPEPNSLPLLLGGVLAAGAGGLASSRRGRRVPASPPGRRLPASPDRG